MRIGFFIWLGLRAYNRIEAMRDRVSLAFIYVLFGIEVRKWDIDGRKPEAPLCRSDYNRYPKVIFSFLAFAQADGCGWFFCCWLLVGIGIRLDAVDIFATDCHHLAARRLNSTQSEITIVRMTNASPIGQKQLGDAERNGGKYHMRLQCHIVSASDATTAMCC